MAKTSQNGLKALALIGGLALLILSARIAVPMYPEATSLLSFAAVLLGALAGAQMGFVTGCLYAASMIVGLPGFIAGGHLAFENPFALRSGGALIGVALAAALAGRLAPGGQGSFGRVLLAMLAAHAVFLVAGALWLMHFEPWKHALYAGIVPYLVPAAAKSAAAAGVLLVLRRFI
jgi:biotin transport system substrate-specific component